MNNLYVNTIKKYLYIYIVLIIEPYSCVTDDILCVWTFGLPGLYNVIKKLLSLKLLLKIIKKKKKKIIIIIIFIYLFIFIINIHYNFN